MYDDRPLKPLAVRRVINQILRECEQHWVADQVLAIQMRHKIQRLKAREYRRSRK